MRRNCSTVLMYTFMPMVVLSCMLAASLVPAQSTQALSIDPVLDTVLSVVSRDRPRHTEDASYSGTDTPSDTSSSAPSVNGKSSDKLPQPAAQTATVEPATTIDPIEPLPLIDAQDMQLATIRMGETAPVITTPPAVLGVSTTSRGVMPLQATSQGWQFFGVAWYWLLSIAGLIYYVVRRARGARASKRVNNNAIVS